MRSHFIVDLHEEVTIKKAWSTKAAKRLWDMLLDIQENKASTYWNTNANLQCIKVILGLIGIQGEVVQRPSEQSIDPMWLTPY